MMGVEDEEGGVLSSGDCCHSDSTCSYHGNRDERHERMRSCLSYKASVVSGESVDDSSLVLHLCLGLGCGLQST